MHVNRIVLRAARRLFHLYQRQLWDDNLEELQESEVEFGRRNPKYNSLITLTSPP